MSKFVDKSRALCPQTFENFILVVCAAKSKAPSKAMSREWKWEVIEIL